MSLSGVIRVLSDGRPGHENQSVGLGLALGRRTGLAMEVVGLGGEAGWLRRLRRAASPGTRRVRLVIAAGHGTHIPLWWAGRKLGAPTVLVMRPSLPERLFDLVLAPQHDFAPGAEDTERRWLTRGALNRVPEQRTVKEPRGLVLIGGPSRHHGWAGLELAERVAALVAARPELAWTVADSRRTPRGFLSEMDLPRQVARVGQTTTGPGWLAEELARTAEVWVTADSVSMAHEAATAGAATGILPVPELRPGGGRPGRAIAALVAAGAAALYPGPARAAASFHEAARCAERIAARWFEKERAALREAKR